MNLQANKCGKCHQILLLKGAKHSFMYDVIRTLLGEGHAKLTPTKK